MDLRQLRCFETIYAQQSISKAAKEMLVSQQCASKLLSNLENELHAQLFVRSSNGVTPTEDGDYLHAYAPLALNTADSIRKHFAEKHSGRKDTLTVGIPRGMNHLASPAFVDQFEKSHPGITLRTVMLWNTEVGAMLRNGDLDVSFVFNHGKDIANEAFHLFNEPFACVVNGADPLAAKNIITLDDLSSRKIVIGDEKYYGESGLDNAFAGKEAAPTVMSMVDLIGIYEFVSQNPGWIGFSLNFYASSLRFSGVKQIPVQAPHSWWDVSLVRNEPSNNSDVFIDFALKTLGERK